MRWNDGTQLADERWKKRVVRKNNSRGHRVRSQLQLTLSHSPHQDLSDLWSFFSDDPPSPWSFKVNRFILVFSSHPCQFPWQHGFTFPFCRTRTPFPSFCSSSSVLLTSECNPLPKRKFFRSSCLPNSSEIMRTTYSSGKQCFRFFTPSDPRSPRFMLGSVLALQALR